MTSYGYILIQDTSGCTITGDETGNIYGKEPLLGPLADHGGYTLTHALLDGSPAIDTADFTDPDGNPVTEDQRGVSRPQGPANDLGADEFYAGCTAVKQVSIIGPANGSPGQQLLFSALVTPADATPLLQYTWSPEPLAGQGTDLPTYRFDNNGKYEIILLVQNCGGSLTALHTITIGPSAGGNIYLPILMR